MVHPWNGLKLWMRTGTIVKQRMIHDHPGHTIIKTG